MGAGKTTLGEEVARRLGRPFVDTDRAVVEASGKSIPELFAEGSFRRVEEQAVAGALELRTNSVIAFGGGAVMTDAVRAALGTQRPFVVHLDVGVEEAWERSRGGDRPLAQNEDEFRRLHAERQPVYREVADAVGRDADEVVLAAAGVRVGLGSLEQLGALIPGAGRLALVTDPHVAGIHGAAAQLALGDRLASAHEVPAGEAAKTAAVVERLWRELRIDRGGTLVALGGGCVTDAAGFAAATYLRGVAWTPVPTTLVGQVDAAIGGKTAIDLPEGKNLAGAFHWPVRVVVDPALLETLPERERREGMAEVVKTGLLAGEPLWELPQAELVRRSASFKAAVCLRDPHDRGERHVLNLGHTFAHALEAAAGYEGLSHGRAVGLGLLAALRLSGRPTDAVEEVLRPERVQVDRDRAWAALGRDKKRGLVLLEDDGARWDVQLPEAEVRRALDELIAD
jgi:shikimate kinase / 3-dehydroquinate synthase